MGKRIFAIILIVLIVAVVVGIIGAGVLVLFPNTDVFGFGLKYVHVQQDSSLQNVASISQQIDLNCGKNVVIESGNYNITVKESDNTTLPDHVFIAFDTNVVGFSVDDKIVCDYKIEEDTTNNQIKITTYEPNGLLFRKDLKITFSLPAQTLSNLKITTAGQVNVENGLTIKNLEVTSTSNFGGSVSVGADVTDLFTLNKDNGSSNFDTINSNFKINSKSGNFTINKVNGNLTVTGNTTKVTVGEVQTVTFNGKYGSLHAKTINENLIVNDCEDATISVSNDNAGQNTGVVKGSCTIDCKKGKIFINSLGNDKTLNSSIDVENAKVEIGSCMSNLEIDAVKAEIIVKLQLSNLVVRGGSSSVNVNQFVIPVVVGTVVYPTTEITSNGKISVTNIYGQVNIQGGEGNVDLEFSDVTTNSSITTSSGAVNIKLNPEENITVNTRTKNSNAVNFDVGGTNAPTGSVVQDSENYYNAVYKINGQKAGGIIDIKTNSSITATANQ